jgi:hypothetical protein
MQIRENPPGSHYGLVLQEVLLLDAESKMRLEADPLTEERPSQ